MGARGGGIMRPLRESVRANRLGLKAGVDVVLRMLKMNITNEDVLGGGNLRPLQLALIRKL